MSQPAHKIRSGASAVHHLAQHRRQGQLVLNRASTRLQARRRHLEGNRQPELRRPAHHVQAARPGHTWIMHQQQADQKARKDAKAA